MRSRTNAGAARGVATVITTAAIALSGCAIMGRQHVDQRISPEAVEQIEKGMSKAKVTELLGAPQEFIFSNKEHDPLREHAYVYYHTTTAYTGIFFALVNFGNMDQKEDRVVVFFDDDGLVEHVGASLNAAKASYGFPFGG